MRVKLVLTAVLLSLAACGRAPQGQVSGGAAAGPPATAPAWVRSQWDTLPEWNTVANIAEGGKLMFSPRSISRDPATGTTDVKVQVLHNEPVPYTQEDSKTVQTTWYFKERATYRFRCAARTYAVVQRDYIGTGDKVVGSDALTPKNDSDWRPIDSSGAAEVLEGPVCKAA